MLPDRGGMPYPPDLHEPMVNGAQTQIRQYSIPATTLFHDGKNDSLVTGSSIQLRTKTSTSATDNVLTHQLPTAVNGN